MPAPEAWREVDALLRAFSEAGSFLETPVVAPINLAETPILAELETVTLPAGTKINHLGNYELLVEIGRGAMGVVYRATDTVLGREVAIKVLSDRFAPDSGASRRFTDEARIAGQLQHPGIPAVHDLGTLPDGRPFLAMKLVKGRTLAELLKDRSDLAVDRVRFLAAFEQVAHAVAFAHARHVIHRDLKPANIMVGAFAEIQVMDWGLAKVLAAGQREPAFMPAAETNASEILTTREAGSSTQDGSVLGTPAFMPPEQAGGEIDKLDERADVFGLGAILCVVLTGKPPYVADTAEAVRLMAVRGRLEDCFARLDACGADPELVALCQRCLAVDRNARPRDAGAVAVAVAAHLAEVEGRARRAELARAEADARAAAEVKTRQVAEEKAAEERKRRKIQVALAAAIGLLLVGGGAVAWWQDKQADQRKAQVNRNADALDDLLDRCEHALRENDAARAAVALYEIDRRLREGGDDTKTARAERCRLALAVTQKLDAIDDFRWTPVENKLPDQKRVCNQWRALFAGLEVFPGETSTHTAGALVSESLLRDRLLTALDLWLAMDLDPGVQAILRAADPDPYRNLVRDATVAANRDRLVELTGRPVALTQPPRFAAALGQMPSLPAERRRAVLLAAQQSRPSDLTLLMGLGGSYRRKQRLAAEEVRWYQAAVVAHPKNPTTHNNLGLALRRHGGPGRGDFRVPSGHWSRPDGNLGS